MKVTSPDELAGELLGFWPSFRPYPNIQGRTRLKGARSARDPFLAGAGFSDDEGRCIARSDPLHTFQQCPGRRVFKNQAAGADREGQGVRVRGNVYGVGLSTLIVLVVPAGFGYLIADCCQDGIGLLRIDVDHGFTDEGPGILNTCSCFGWTKTTSPC